jgi:hypothetical protein
MAQVSFQKRVTLSYRNKFTFTCPIFNSKTEMGACMKLRDLVWAGAQVDVRRGCQAAMGCSMCPVAALVSMHIYNNNWDNDFHGSIEPKEGKLHAQVLDRVARVIPREDIVKKLGLSETEHSLLYSARERIAEQLKTAPGEKPKAASDYEAPARASKPKPKKSAAPAPKTEDAVATAAKSGDLAAAINAAA